MTDPNASNPYGVRVLPIEDDDPPRPKIYSYKVVCTKHGDIEPVGHKSPYDLGHCPECLEAHPDQRYPHELMVVPVKAEVIQIDDGDLDDPFPPPMSSEGPELD